MVTAEEPCHGYCRGAMVTAEELESISESFDESLRLRLWGLSPPASVSLPWLSSAVDVITFAHSTARSLIYEVNLDSGESLSLWYSGDSVKVLDICNCILSEIERLCLPRPNLTSAIQLLCSDVNPSEEEIHQARSLLAEWWEGEGGDGHVKSTGDLEGLIRDLAVSMGMSASRGKVSPVERVVCRAIRAVSFVTAFLTGVMSSGMRSSSREVVCLDVPEEFSWVDSVRAIQSAVAVDRWCSEETDGTMRILKELDDMEPCMKELDDLEVSVWHVLDTMDDVAESGGGEEVMARLREAAIWLEDAAEAMWEGMYQLREKMKKLVLTVTRMREEVADEFHASVQNQPSKPGGSVREKSPAGN